MTDIRARQAQPPPADGGGTPAPTAPAGAAATGTAAGAGAGTGAGTADGVTAAPAARPDRPGGTATSPNGTHGTGGEAGAGGGGQRLGGFLARAAAVTAALTAAGSLFGLVRDQAIAQLFGADADTDAFLVAWTVPELASTLLIEDAMALILVPAFSLALSRSHALATGGAGTAGPEPAADPVRRLVARTMPRLALGLAAAAGALALAAPLVVRLMAPGLPNPGTAVDCMRLTAVTVVAFGLAGYFSAALRAHRHFLAPAAIYVAYNVGIIAAMFAGHAVWGVRAAAVGVALGGVLMVLVQLPAFLARLPLRRRRGRTGHGAPEPGGERRPAAAPPPPAAASTASTASTASVTAAAAATATATATRTAAPAPAPAPADAARPGGAARRAGLGLALGVVAPVSTFALSRQAQVLFERYLASSLPEGAISHLNYAQKVAQMPMVLSLMVCTVTFPVVARAMADGRPDRAARRVERDLALVGIVVLLGAAYVVACAPQIIQLLFERGAFDARDTAGTASVMRVYSCGLLGHSLVGALVRPYFSGNRPTWYPAAAMGVGLAVTVAAGVVAAGYWGVYGLAAGNALGIWTTALLLLRGIGPRVVAVDVRRVAAGLLRLVLAAGAAAAAGWAVAHWVPWPLPAAAAGGLAVLVVFGSVALLVRAPEVPQLFATVKQRLPHVR